MTTAKASKATKASKAPATKSKPVPQSLGSSMMGKLMQQRVTAPKGTKGK